MAHHSEHTFSSPEEAKYAEYLKNGDDFMKIEIYRLAREWYKKALATDINSETVNKKLAELEVKSKFEQKVLVILGTMAGVIILSAIIANLL